MLHDVLLREWDPKLFPTSCGISHINDYTGQQRVYPSDGACKENQRTRATWPQSLSICALHSAGVQEQSSSLQQENTKQTGSWKWYACLQPFIHFFLPFPMFACTLWGRADGVPIAHAWNFCSIWNSKHLDQLSSKESMILACLSGSWEGLNVVVWSSRRSQNKL